MHRSSRNQFVTNSIQTVFPTLVVQQILNALAVRQLIPRGPDDDIVPPRDTKKVDYEAEVAVVIGRRGRYINAADALDHVFGAMAFNDVSARDLQLANQLWTGGKAIDTFAPCGPAVVSTDMIGDLQNLHVRTRVNDELLQDGNTSSMIFPVREIIAFLSRKFIRSEWCKREWEEYLKYEHGLARGDGEGEAHQAGRQSVGRGRLRVEDERAPHPAVVSQGPVQRTVVLHAKIAPEPDQCGVLARS